MKRCIDIAVIGVGISMRIVLIVCAVLTALSTAGRGSQIAAFVIIGWYAVWPAVRMMVSAVQCIGPLATRGVSMPGWRVQSVTDFHTTTGASGTENRGDAS
jgi:hypothetical protein